MPISKHPLTQVFFALSDETRLRIIRLMAITEARTCLSEFTEVFEMPASKLSKHIQLLAGAGMVMQEKVGRWVWLTLNRAEPHLEYLYSAVVALEDIDGVFSGDLSRFSRISPERNWS